MRHGWLMKGMPWEISCERQVPAFQFERLRGEFQTGPQIVAFQIGEFGQQVFKRVSCREILEHGLDRVPQVADGRFAVANLRINRDAGQKLIHVLNNNRIA